MNPIDRPAQPPEPADEPVLHVVGKFLQLSSGSEQPDTASLAEVVTPTSLGTWVSALAASELRSRLRRVAILQRKPHYTEPDVAEVLLPILHPDDIDLGYVVPEGEDVAIPAVIGYVRRISGRWLVHSLQGTDF